MFRGKGKKFLEPLFNVEKCKCCEGTRLNLYSNYVKVEGYTIKDFINMYPNNLSGGMRQRVALIRTLAIKPEILLLDEAFSKLDSQTKKFVIDDIYNILKEEKISCIMVTHDISDAITFSDRILILQEKPSIIKKEIKTNMTEIPSKRVYEKEYLKLLKEVDDNV